MENSTNLKGGGAFAHTPRPISNRPSSRLNRGSPVRRRTRLSTTVRTESRRKTTSGAERSTESSNNGQTTGDHEKDAKNSDARCSSCNGIGRMFEGGRIR